MTDRLYQNLLDEKVQNLFQLMKSGIKLDYTLESLIEIYENAYSRNELSSYQLVLYFKMLIKNNMYKRANTLTGEIIQLIANDKLPIGLIKLKDLYDSKYLEEFKTSKSFISHFGPFSIPIYSDCKSISFRDAEDELYGNNNICNDIASLKYEQSQAILVNGLLIYEVKSEDKTFKQSDILIHEMMHKYVSDKATFNVDGEWKRVWRDIPIASVYSYKLLIERCEESNIAIPNYINYWVELGRESYKNNTEEIESYISNMLKYYEHGFESNGSYFCAAIYLGILLEMFENDKLLYKYLTSIMMFNHFEAMELIRSEVIIKL